jgi:Ran GTPase-activating protein (RanGAP) involved in mRNA processing and transport
MISNAIGHHGFSHLSTLLKIGCINYLCLAYDNLLLKQDTVHAPFYKELEINTTLQDLRLQGCGLNSQSAESLAEALTTNKHLKVLNLSDNALCDDGIQHLAHALRVNQGLKELHLASCGMTDVGLECLVKSLQHNNVLNKLSAFNLDDNPNKISEKIIPVLTKCLQNNRTLTELQLPKNLKSSTASIEEAVNDVRKRNGLPFIKVEGRSIPLNENGRSM